MVCQITHSSVFQDEYLGIHDVACVLVLYQILGFHMLVFAH
jgi:hypothetical protein